jgi:hypothetical protein
MIRGENYDDFRRFFEVICMGGINPSRFKFPPNGREEVWGFSTPPVYEWVSREAFKASFSLERLPGWGAYD